jgi:hypothetical protein
MRPIGMIPLLMVHGISVDSFGLLIARVKG